MVFCATYYKIINRDVERVVLVQHRIDDWSKKENIFFDKTGKKKKKKKNIHDLSEIRSLGLPV